MLERNRLIALRELGRMALAVPRVVSSPTLCITKLAEHHARAVLF